MGVSDLPQGILASLPVTPLRQSGTLGALAVTSSVLRPPDRVAALAMDHWSLLR
ncbi:hypothetical protein [Rhodococcus sp. 24CO]|uniref:hypothetical protein n=1 Tax=Rhodococcus sp. 24CO TaxID=3117460 RepID=UPI003D33A646